MRAARGRAGHRMRPVGAEGMKYLTARMRPSLTLVTAFDTDARPWGATCTFLATVAQDPPTVLVSLHRDGPTAQAALALGEFALNLLPRGARTTAGLFADEESDAFDRVDWTVPRGATGPHLSGDALAVADCAIAGHSTHDDQVTLFAKVRHVLLKPTRRCGLLAAAFGLVD
ncbi:MULTISPECIES: flavin reductase family protein [unclassified Streptomyces]|uniref:flavin reductase family protein n=1 Tax=unclassified Streptomyces TaxID=2593676 RepID=UPI00099DD91E|nr:flavin reductase family protein [Streptomyces sp. NRRL F-5727]